MDVCGEAYIGDHRTRLLVESGGDCCTLHHLSCRNWLWEIIELIRLQGSSSMRRIRLTIAASLATSLASLASLALGRLIGLVTLLREVDKVILQEEAVSV
jgi:hypothetical protein